MPLSAQTRRRRITDKPLIPQHLCHYRPDKRNTRNPIIANIRPAMNTATVDTTSTSTLINSCDSYLAARTGRYEWRRLRYRYALDVMVSGHQLEDSDTVYDVGAGWTEFDFCLRTEAGFKGRYIPVDGSIDGTNLEQWMPPRDAEWFVALELLEHLSDPYGLLSWMIRSATKGVIISTPNQRTVDVLAMDADHKQAISAAVLERTYGMTVEECSFYGGPADSLFAFLLKRDGGR